MKATPTADGAELWRTNSPTHRLAFIGLGPLLTPWSQPGGRHPRFSA